MWLGYACVCVLSVSCVAAAGAGWDAECLDGSNPSDKKRAWARVKTEYPLGVEIAIAERADMMHITHVGVHTYADNKTHPVYVGGDSPALKFEAGQKLVGGERTLRIDAGFSVVGVVKFSSVSSETTSLLSFMRNRSDDNGKMEMQHDVRLYVNVNASGSSSRFLKFDVHGSSGNIVCAAVSTTPVVFERVYELAVLYNRVGKTVTFHVNGIDDMVACTGDGASAAFDLPTTRVQIETIGSVMGLFAVDKLMVAADAKAALSVMTPAVANDACVCAFGYTRGSTGTAACAKCGVDQHVASEREYKIDEMDDFLDAHVPIVQFEAIGVNSNTGLLMNRCGGSACAAGATGTFHSTSPSGTVKFLVGDAAAASGSAKRIPYLYGAPGMTVHLGDVPDNFTICSVTRYAGSARQRILGCLSEDGKESFNWYHGHNNGTAGVAAYDGTGQIAPAEAVPVDNWVVVCGMNVANTKLSSGSVNGVITESNAVHDGKGNCELQINPWSDTSSDWQLSRVYVWGKHLSQPDFRAVSSMLNSVVRGADEKNMCSRCPAHASSVLGSVTCTCKADYTEVGGSGSGCVHPPLTNPSHEVVLTIQLPLTEAQFDDHKQDMFKFAISEVAGVHHDDVAIASVTSVAGAGAARRLLAGSINVKTVVSTNSLANANRLQGLLTLDALNRALVAVCMLSGRVFSALCV